MPTNTIKLEWTPAKLLATKIEFITLIMADIETSDEYGRKLYSILEPYLYLLIRQHKGFTTDPEEFQEMKNTIHALDALFCDLMSQQDGDGSTGTTECRLATTCVSRLANLLIQIRNELLIAIAKYMKSRKFNSLSPNALTKI